MYFLTPMDKGRFDTLLSGGKESSRSHYRIIPISPLPSPDTHTHLSPSLPPSLSVQEIGPEGTSRVFVCCKVW